MGLKRFCSSTAMVAGQLLFVTIVPTLCALAIFAVAVIALTATIAVDVIVPLLTSDLPQVCKCLLFLHVFTGSYMLICILKVLLVDLIKVIIIQWSVIIVTEVIADKLFEFKHSADPSPELGVTKEEWELMAVARSTNNGYGCEQFYPATICDPIPIDRSDPFWPHHITLMYTFELRRRTMLWKEVNVWQVSLLSGVQKKLLVHFNLGIMDTPFQRVFDSGKVGSYQSQGVLFMILLDSLPNKLLLVYDIRQDKKAIVKLHDELRIAKLVSVTCQQRLFDANGMLQGWRILLLDTFMRRDDEDEGAFHLIFTKTVMNIRTNGRRAEATVISTRASSFSGFNSDRDLKAVHTSDGMFGVYAKAGNPQDGPTVLYDQFQRVLVFCPTFADLLDLDRPFDSYSHKANQIFDDELCPAIINDRECIAAFRNGTFYRLRLRPQTIMYTAALTLFRSNESVKKSMNADQFRELTGVSGMEAHLE